MKLKVDIPKPPPKTFHLELTEEEASLLCMLIRCVDINDNPETKKLYGISDELWEYFYDSLEYKNLYKRFRPNGRLEIGTHEGVELSGGFVEGVEW